MLNAIAEELLALLPGVLAARPIAASERSAAQAMLQQWRTSDLPSMVMEQEAGCILGDPPAQGFSLLLPLSSTHQLNTCWTFGPDFEARRVPQHLLRAIRGAHPSGCLRSESPPPGSDFLQLLWIHTETSLTRAQLSRWGALRSLARRLPGYYARSMGVRGSARIHRDLMRAGFSQRHLAVALMQGLESEGLRGVVAVGSPTHEALRHVQPLLQRFEKHKAELPLESAQSDEGCEGRDCHSCDERDVCTKIRALLSAIKRGRRQ
ncbi:MAG: hypothetical protein RBU37_01810 [Myxococcota bacterium]|jgi:hypothetical protein|nr:hypothetical protein [Myxococcota bacterium]